MDNLFNTYSDMTSYQLWIIPVAVFVLSILSKSVRYYIISFIKSSFPEPNDICDRIKQKFRPKQPEGYFTLLVLNLENDPNGSHRNHVTDTFRRRGLRYRTLNRSLVASPKAMDSVQIDVEHLEKGRQLLQKQNADLLIFGEVAESNKWLRLRFISSKDHDFKQPAFEIQGASLSDEFHHIFDIWLTTVVLNNIYSSYDQHGRRLLEDMLANERKLSDVLRSNQDNIKPPLQIALRQNLAILGLRISTLSGENDKLECAINDFRNILNEYDRSTYPLAWATIQTYLGIALTTLGDRESQTNNIHNAVDAFQEVLQEFTQKKVPLDYAMTQNNLGKALARLGDRESGTKNSHNAVNAFKKALLEYTRKRSPLDWAMVQNNLGGALTVLGKKENGAEQIEYLRKARKAFKNALREYTRKRSPLDWAMVQNNLGSALTVLSEKENGAEQIEYLREARKAFKNALREYTRKISPLDWAMTQNSLGCALAGLSEKKCRLKKIILLLTARYACKKARSVYIDVGDDHHIRRVESNLDLINNMIANCNKS